MDFIEILYCLNLNDSLAINKYISEVLASDFNSLGHNLTLKLFLSIHLLFSVLHQVRAVKDTVLNG